MNESSVLTNRCVMDEATLRRTYRRIFRRNLLLFYLGSGLMAVFGLLLILLTGGLSPFPGFLLIAAALYLFLGLRQPGKQARRQIARYEESGSAPNPEVTVWFREEELSAIRAGMGEQTRISYDSMNAILPDKDRIILWTEAKQFVVLDVSRFENGTEADFWRLMKEKCSHALPKSRR